MALKTDYKDDILLKTANAMRKYEKVENDDGTYSFLDVTEYEQKGSTFGAADINETNEMVNQCFQSVSDGKALLASAITGKGVTTAQDATFAAMAENIEKISSGGREKYASHMEEAYYAGENANNSWYGSLANEGVSLEANSTYIVICAYSQSIAAHFADVNFKCAWDSVTFPEGTTATLLHEDMCAGISMLRVYKVFTGAVAGAIKVVAQLNGHYDKYAVLEVCALK